MAYDRVGYINVFLQKTKNAQLYVDFTLNDEATAIVAWNPTLGIAPTPEELEAGVQELIKSDLIARINLLAGQIRSSYLSDGEYVVEEYRLAEAEAADFISRAYSEPITPCVKDYADLFPEPDYAAAADEIMAMADQLRTLLTAVRKIRLSCTVGIRTAPTIDDAQQVFEYFRQS